MPSDFPESSDSCKELHNSYAWQHLPNLDMEILDTCDGPAKVLSDLARGGTSLHFLIHKTGHLTL